MIVKLLTEHHLVCLSLIGGCRGSSESTHVKTPHCWKSHTLAQIITYDPSTSTMANHVFILGTVVQTMSNSDVIFCLQLLSKTLHCTLHFS